MQNGGLDISKNHNLDKICDKKNRSGIKRKSMHVHIVARDHENDFDFLH